jgi:hypothetical protein
VTDSDQPADWTVRSFVYSFTAEHGRPPAVSETAAGLGMSAEQSRAAYEWLNDNHAIFLEPGQHTVRMAHPFSGVPTSFRVHANGRDYWANCAWDALGIPAALNADARIDAVCADDQQPAALTVEGGAVRGHGELVHFLQPFRQWYDDLIVT